MATPSNPLSRSVYMVLLGTVVLFGGLFGIIAAFNSWFGPRNGFDSFVVAMASLATFLLGSGLLLVGAFFLSREEAAARAEAERTAPK